MADLVPACHWLWIVRAAAGGADRRHKRISVGCRDLFLPGAGDYGVLLTDAGDADGRAGRELPDCPAAADPRRLGLSGGRIRPMGRLPPAQTAQPGGGQLRRLLLTESPNGDDAS